jgi:hypothetical protein
MTLRQVRTPNVNVSAIPGYCLKYVDDAIDARERQPTAQIAYNVQKDKGNIRTSDLPINLWVPIFFSLNGGDFAGLGHVAWAYNHGDYVEIHDSEVHSGARAPYRSIGEVLRWFGNYGIEYLGWSFAVDGAQAIEDYQKPPKPQPPKFVPLDDGPRIMIATTDLHKFNPDTKQYDKNPTLFRNKVRLFEDKVIVDGNLYVRTAYDKKNGNRLAFNFANLLEVPPIDEIVRVAKG